MYITRVKDDLTYNKVKQRNEKRKKRRIRQKHERVQHTAIDGSFVIHLKYAKMHQRNKSKVVQVERGEEAGGEGGGYPICAKKLSKGSLGLPPKSSV